MTNVFGSREGRAGDWCLSSGVVQSGSEPTNHAAGATKCVDGISHHCSLQGMRYRLPLRIRMPMRHDQDQRHQTTNEQASLIIVTIHHILHSSSNLHDLESLGQRLGDVLILMLKQSKRVRHIVPLSLVLTSR